MSKTEKKINKNAAIRRITTEAKKFFAGASGCHDWSHVERVRNLAMHIGRREKADLFVLEVAALLHDIGRKREIKNKGKFCHAEEGAKLADKILKRYGFDDKTVADIKHCIISHRYRNSYIPESIEAKVLYDADKLDSIGAVGVARTCLFAGNAGSNTLYTGNEKRIARSRVNHSYTDEDSAYLEYEIKLKYIKDRMLTKTGKSMARGRHEFMKKYFERMWLEVKGKI